jgi:hypothetical protein
VNIVLSGKFENKRENVIEGWRKLHKFSLYNSNSSPQKINTVRSKRIRRTDHVTHMEEIRNLYKISVGKPEGEKPLGRRRER